MGRAQIFWDDSGIQRLIEDDSAEIQAMLEQGESAIRGEEILVRLYERVTFLSGAAELETTAQTSTPLKREDASYGKRKNMGDETLLEGGRSSQVVAFEIGDGS